MVLSREMSRLSRTDKDWCQLQEVCQVFGVLLADAERVYDLSTMDDQLILGIKGTMSVVELNVLKMRLMEGMQAKARRGELFVWGGIGRDLTRSRGLRATLALWATRSTWIEARAAPAARPARLWRPSTRATRRSPCPARRRRCPRQRSTPAGRACPPRSSSHHRS